MKKYLFVLAATMFCLVSNVSAEEGDKDLNLRPQHNHKPRTPQSEIIITCTYDNEELTLSFTGYNGVTNISLVDVSSQQIVYHDTNFVTSPDTLSINVSQVPVSTYYLFVELEDGTIYYGCIQL